MSTFYTDSGSFNDISTTGSTLISGSLVVSGTISFPTIGSSTRPNFVSIDIVSGQLYYASTSSFTAATASYVTASNVYGPFGTNSILSASYASGSTSASYASSSTSASYASSSTSASYALSASYVTGSIHSSTNPALSASYASGSTSASYASTATSASYASGSTSASYASGSTSASYASFATSASYASASTSASYAQTSSYALNISQVFPYNGSAVITGSLLISGSGLTVTGSVNITGSLNATASWAVSASQALSASYITGSIYSSINPALSASYASGSTSSSYANFATSASYASGSTSASYANFATSASYASGSTSASYANFATSASYASGSTSASYASASTSASYASASTSASYALSASYVTGSIHSSTNPALSASYASGSTSASYASTATSASYASGSTSASYASFATSASYASGSTSASYASASTSASYALSASYITGSIHSSTNPALSASYASGSTSASYASFATSASYASGSTSASYANFTTSASYSSGSTSASYASFTISASYASGSTSASYSITSSYITGSIHSSTNPALSASYASGSTSASYALTSSNVQGGQDRYITRWIGATALTRSIIYETSDPAIVINYDGTNPGTLGKLRVSGSIGVIGDGHQIGPSTVGSTLDFIGTKLTISGSTLLSGSISLSGSLSVLGIANTNQANFLAYNTNGTVTYATTSSFTASYAATASQVENGRASYMTLWQTATRLTSSTALYEAADGKLLLGRGLTVAAANGDVQVSGSLGVGAFVGTADIRPAGSADANKLRIIASELRLSGAQSNALAYADGATFSIVGNSDSTLLVDIGRYSTSPLGRFRVNNTTSGRVTMGLSSSFGWSFIANQTGGPDGSGSVGINIANGSPTSTLHVSGTVELDGLANTSQANFLAYNSSTGNITYAATSSFTAATASFVTASNVYGWNGSNSILNASTSIFPIKSDSAAVEGNLWSTGPASNLGASTTKRSIALGYGAGTDNSNSTGQVSIGYGAGVAAGGVGYSVSLGYEAGNSLIKASTYSTFIGYNAGKQSGGNNQIFIGNSVASGSDLSNNNIIIGTNITLPTSTTNGLNIGGLIFGTGAYGTTTGVSYSGSSGGNIGIGTSTPLATLHVSGTDMVVGTSTITGSLIVSSSLTIIGTTASFVAPAPPNIQYSSSAEIANGANVWRGATAYITPRKSGTIMVICTGVVSSPTLANISKFTLYYSASATAPTAGAANPQPTAITQIGQAIQLNMPSASAIIPFTVQGMVNLTIGTPYWIDLRQDDPGGSVTTSSFVTLTAFEL